jgi:L-iditol 2-dehydrogenase
MHTAGHRHARRPEEGRRAADRDPIVRVAVYYNNRDIRLEERPLPAIGPGELLMRVESSGICGSDVMEWYRIKKAPIVLGHEVAGVVEEVGPGVTAFEPGDRIVTTHHVPCGRCRYCESDRHSVCETLRTTHFDPGGFSEYVRLPALNVELGTFRLPEQVNFEEGSFVEPLACAIRAQRLAGVQLGDTVAVLGSGMAGALHIQLAKALGAECIIATDVHPFRLGMARRLGADAAIDARGDVPALLRVANDGRLADRVIVCTAAPGAIRQAFECVDRGGSILIFAILPPGTELTLPMGDLARDGISILHSYAGPPAEMQEALRLLAERRIDVASMVTHRIGLAETQRGFGLVCEAGDSLKVIVEPRR